MRQYTTTFGLFLFFVSATLTPAVEFKRQTITVPSDLGWLLFSHLQDIDDDGLMDLLVLASLKHELLVYRQRISGFTAKPNQTIELHKDAAWSGLHDVDPHPGNELLLSTATGIVYFRQNQGVFESSPQSLIEVPQVFRTKYPSLMVGLSEWGDANSVVPITSEDRTVLYQKDSSGEWRPARTLDLEAMQTSWRTYTSGNWAIESSSSRSMTIRTLFRADPEGKQTQARQSKEAETRKIIEQIRKDTQWSFRRSQHQDINGDDREDLILWRTRGDLNPKIIVLIFIRGRDDQLPEKYTHVLRDNGFPIYINSGREISPMWDLDGDDQCELILVALKTRLTSWTGLVDLFLSGGVDWVFTVRSGRNGDYSGGSDFKMDVTSGLPRENSISSLFKINGDFNGDGRVDIIIERSPEQFDVYCSSKATGFFQEGPALMFKVPVEPRRVNITDLNGDGISDLFVQGLEQAYITIFLSQSEKPKGAQK